MTLGYEQQLAAQAVELDYGDEVPYAFGYLPENARLNEEMYRRAVERARRKRVLGEQPLDKEPK